jgi:hypothetical protein
MQPFVKTSEGLKDLNIFLYKRHFGASQIFTMKQRDFGKLKSVCHQRMEEGLPQLPQLPSFHTKSQVLEIHKREKHFKVSHNKKSHKVKILARIYFSITE